MAWFGRRRSRYGSYGFKSGYGGFAPYVPVAQRQANAAAHAKKLAKKEGRELAPVKIQGRAMAQSYWGKAWCENLEAYSDYANRLPRGRTYARNGSVIDLQIKPGKIEAIVSGSDIYHVVVSIHEIQRAAWARLKEDCSQSIASLLDLLQGKFDEGVMRRLAHQTNGLFPQPKEIKLKCSCPDSATLCKHVAAVMYGVGNRLDSSPELLFTLRNVNHLELINQAMTEGNLAESLTDGQDNSLAGADLEEMFGIELERGEATPKKSSRKKQVVSKQPLEKPAPTGKTRRKAAPMPKTAATAKKPAAAKSKTTVAAKRRGSVAVKAASSTPAKRKAK